MPIEGNDFFSMLGIAMRAGALTLGESGTDKAIAAGEAGLVLVDAEASDNTRKRFADSCAYYGAPMLLTAGGRLGIAVGKPGRMSAAVRKGTLCDKLASLAKAEAARSSYDNQPATAPEGRVTTFNRCEEAICGGARAECPR